MARGGIQWAACRVCWATHTWVCTAQCHTHPGRAPSGPFLPACQAETVSSPVKLQAFKTSTDHQLLIMVPRNSKQHQVLISWAPLRTGRHMQRNCKLLLHMRMHACRQASQKCCPLELWPTPSWPKQTKIDIAAAKGTEQGNQTARG